MRQGQWDRVGELRGIELKGRTLGIVGLGHSGRELARLAAHQTAGTLDVYYNAGSTHCQAMVQAAQGRLPPNIVNREVLNRPGFQAKLQAIKTASEAAY